MKQGILITAYKNFDHLIDIIEYFDDNFEIYIHIDSKINVEEKVLERIIKIQYVKLVSRKFKVNWGGINHLKCILHLADEALKNEALETIHLISGHDYPIKRKSYFFEFFEQNKGKDFFSHFELPSKHWLHGGLNRLKYYNLYDVLDAKKYRKYIIKFVELQSKLNITRSISKKVPKLYGGETWWSLSKETLKYVVDYTKQNSYFLNRLKHSFCSEEIYFQTVIMNSKYVEKTVNDCLRYIDWNDRNGNFPANLDVSDWSTMKSSNKLFARKFDFPVSQELKQIINKELKQV